MGSVVKPVAVRASTQSDGDTREAWDTCESRDTSETLAPALCRGSND